jgi:MFS family permease
VREPNRLINLTPTTLFDDFVKCWQERALRYIMAHNWINALIAGAVTSTLIIYLSQISPRLPSSVQGVIFALPGIFVALLSLRWVKLGERISYYRVVTIGLIGAGVFYIVMGLSINAWMFIPAFALCRGFATAISPSLSALISRDVSSEFRGRAFGIQTSVGTMGELSAQILVASVGQLLGIHALYIFIGLGVFLLGVRNYLVLSRSRFSFVSQ